MLTALVMLKVERDQIGSVADSLAALDGVSEVYTVAGRFDLAVIMRVRDHEQLEDLVTDHLLKLNAIRDSETHIALRAYSRFDLDKVFPGKGRAPRARRGASPNG